MKFFVKWITRPLSPNGAAESQGALEDSVAPVGLTQGKGTCTRGLRPWLLSAAPLGLRNEHEVRCRWATFRTSLRSCRLLVILALITMPAAPIFAQTAPVQDSRTPRQMLDEYHQVDAYLARLDLTDQRLLLLERYLARPLPAPQRERLLETASTLYATQLLTHADDPARSKYYLQQVRKFLDANPTADKPALQVMLLQADYNRAEAAASRWLADPADEASLKVARDDFRRIAPKLTEYHTTLQKRVAEEYRAIDRMPTGPTRESREQENESLEGVVGRAAFFGAWSSYYLALVTDQQNAPDLRRTAIRLFRDLLGIPADTGGNTANKTPTAAQGPWYEQVDPHRLGLQQDWRARALIGLGMAEILDGDLSDGRRAFDLLAAGPVSPDLADQADYWYCRGLINAGRLTEAAQYAQKAIETFQGVTSPGKTSLCVLLADTGLRAAARDPAIRQMGVQGLVGLARLGHHSAAIQLMTKYEVTIEQAPGFYMQWLVGQQKFAEAEKTKAEADYRAAQKLLRDALASPEAEKDLLSASECRYTLGWCNYRLKSHVAAGTSFQEAVGGLKGPNPSKAAEAAWMAFVSYQAIANEQPRYGLRAIEVLEDLKRDFPNHAYAQKADYFIAKLQQSRGSTSSSIRQLQAIDPADPNYVSARLDLCNLLRRQIDQAPSEDEKRELAQQLQAAADDLRSRVKPGSDDPTKISGTARCVLMVADLARRGLLEKSRFRESVDQAQKLVQILPADDKAWPDFHYQALLLAREEKQEADVARHAEWLLAHAAGTSYEQSALIVKALAIDRQVAASTTPDTALLEEGFDVYRRLTDHLGKTPAAVAKSKNAQVACSKAASFAEQLGRPDDAATYLRILVTAYPQEQDYLQRLGRQEFTLGNFAAALPHWRTLLVGLKGSTPPWFEAKYYQLASLHQTDPTQAQAVLKQFQLLHPDWGLPPWRDKIKELAAQIGDS